MRSMVQATAFAFLIIASPVLRADELLPANTPIEEVVDQYVERKLRDVNSKLAPQIDDAAFLRRVTLDLTGRIPTQAELTAFVDTNLPDKRAKLADRLMSSPAFVRYQATVLDTFLMEETGASIRDYLVQALKENRTWDRIFRELMLPDQKDPKQKAIAEFLKRRAKDPDQLTNEVSVLFFGVNVSCAKCHDHPLVDDWKQSHFFGMKSFLARTIDNGGYLAEREFGQVTFKTTKGIEHTAKMMFLTGKVVDDPLAKKAPSKAEQDREKKRLNEYKKKKQPAPEPKFSARRKLVEMALQPGQRDFFARSIANRIWHQYFGRGLVMPLDQMHSGNPPSHPELLEWLARDTAEHGYDLRRLIRGLVLTRAYARGSAWPDDDPPSKTLFAIADVRALTPAQLSTSIQIAISDPQRFENLKPDEFEKRIEEMENRGRGIASQIEQPSEKFQIGVGEALLFSNDEGIQRDLLSAGGDRLIAKLKDLKDDKEIVDRAVRTIYCRAPTADETTVLTGFLQERKERRLEACQQLVWALLTSAEFRFNY